MSQFIPTPLGQERVLVSASDSSAVIRANAAYRCTGTNDQTVINAAIAAAGTNGVVELDPKGSYSISDTITLGVQGAQLSGGNITETAVLLNFIEVTADDCIVANVKINGIEDVDSYDYQVRNSGIKLTSADNAKVRGCTIRNKSLGIHATAASVYSFTDNSFYGFGTTLTANHNFHVAFYILDSDSDDGLIQGNYVYDYASGCTIGTVTQNTRIIANRFDTFYDNGTYLSSAERCVVTGNIYSNGRGVTTSGIKVRGSLNTVTGNVVRDCGIGISVSGIGSTSSVRSTVEFRRRLLHFNSGGPTEPKVSDTITGATSGATGTITKIARSAGRWARTASDGAMTATGTTLTSVKSVSDGAISSGDATLTSQSAFFSSDDVGKSITVTGAGVASADLTTTIASYTSPTEVELTDNASTTVSGETVEWDGNINFIAGDVGKQITVSGAGVAGATLFTTIASYTSATQVELSSAAATTVSSSNVRIEDGAEGTLFYQPTSLPQRRVVTFTAATDICTDSAHTLNDGDAIEFIDKTDAAGLEEGTTYYVRDATATTFKVALTDGGAAVDITSDGNARYIRKLLVDTGTDTITLATHGFSDDDVICFIGSKTRVPSTASNNGTTQPVLPGGLSIAANYYVVNSDTNTFQVSLTQGGSAIDVTSQAAGLIEVYKPLLETENINIAAQSNVMTFDVWPEFNGVGNVVSNNSIENSYVAGIYFVAYYNGESYFNQHNGIVQGNTISQSSFSTVAGYYGINFQCMNGICDGNNLVGMDRECVAGIICSTTLGVHNSGVTISNNRVDATDADYGIYVQNMHDVTISNNYAVCDGTALLCSGVNNELKVQGNTFYGLVDLYHANYTFTCNEVHGLIRSFLDDNTCEDYARIRENTITSEGRGIDFRPAGNVGLVDISENYVNAATDAIVLSLSSDESVNKVIKRLQLQNNQCYTSGATSYAFSLGKNGSTYWAVDLMEVTGGHYENLAAVSALQSVFRIEAASSGTLRMNGGIVYHNGDTQAVGQNVEIISGFATTQFTGTTFGHPSQKSRYAKFNNEGILTFVDCIFNGLSNKQIDVGSNVTDVVIVRPIVGYDSDYTEFSKSSATGNFTLIKNVLPTSDPSLAGAWWNDAGTVKVSAG